LVNTIGTASASVYQQPNIVHTLLLVVLHCHAIDLIKNFVHSQRVLDGQQDNLPMAIS
jgi:hypothetical protein